ncbi:MAG: glycine cleavage system protein H [Gemmataceae bacterium]|nr:glycine cleavage system protein H [Gemmataceae bacterium]
MPESLTFLMGKHPAELPGGLLYCKNHMWCRPGADGVHTFGFSAYAVRLMQDVYFLEWRIDPGLVTLKQEIGYIETQKATSGLYAPAAGRITRFNAELLDDPSAINADGYGRGWLFELAGPVDGTLTAAEYHDFLTTAWAQAQRLIKGQLNAPESDPPAAP